MAPSKTYNIAGLECSFAIVQNPELRKRLNEARRGLVHGANMLGYIAATAAYRDGQPWLDELLAYLQCNRDILVEFANHNLPGVRMWKPQGTYLGWLDCREVDLPGKACDFFMGKARVGLNGGEMFGKGGAGFVRFNFATPRALLLEALEKMRQALVSR
jgi:cystathionine beta-lyase